MQLVRPGVTMFDGMKSQAHRPRRGGREVRRAAGKGHRRAGSGGRLHRQRAGRAGHRHQDGGRADRYLWRSRYAAGAGRRDQAAEAAREAHRVCRAGAHLASARDAEGRCTASRSPIETFGVQRSQCRGTVGLPQNDGIQHTDKAHRGRLGRRGAAAARRFGRRQPQSPVADTDEKSLAALEASAPEAATPAAAVAAGAALARAKPIDRSRLRNGDDTRSTR